MMSELTKDFDTAGNKIEAGVTVRIANGGKNSYLEGVVQGFTKRSGLERYAVLVTKNVVDGEETGKNVGKIATPMVNGAHLVDGVHSSRVSVVTGVDLQPVEEFESKLPNPKRPPKQKRKTVVQAPVTVYTDASTDKPENVILVHGMAVDQNCKAPLKTVCQEVCRFFADKQPDGTYDYSGVDRNKVYDVLTAWDGKKHPQCATVMTALGIPKLKASGRTGTRSNPPVHANQTQAAVAAA